MKIVLTGFANEETKDYLIKLKHELDNAYIQIQLNNNLKVAANHKIKGSHAKPFYSKSRW